MESINLGGLRKQVVWQKRTGFTSDTNTNQQIPAFTGQGTFFAAVIPLSADERIWGQAQQSLLTHKVIMRWVGNIVEQDRLSYTRYYPDGTNATTTLEIQSVIDVDERHRELVLLCKEVR